MPVSAKLRIAARCIATLGLIALGVGSSASQTSAQQIAALEPSQSALPARGPFGLDISGHNSFSEKWRGVQRMIRLEAPIIALCRSQPQTCSPAAAKFVGIVEAARARSGRAQLGEVNRAVNLAIRPMSDQAQFGVPDFWASPLVTFASGAGDCEDYAIAKYVALRQAGVAAKDVRLIVLRDRRETDQHAVVAARVEGQWLILDNRRMTLMVDTDVDANMAPLYALGDDEENRAPAIASAAKPGV